MVARNESARRPMLEAADARPWDEIEAQYREECAALLRDARRHLEQRVASEQAKIDNALAAFARDFDAWLERERRGDSSPKPNLGTLFELWLERGSQAAASASERAKRRAAEAEATALREQLAAEAARAGDLEQRLALAATRRPPRLPVLIAVLALAALGAVLGAAHAPPPTARIEPPPMTEMATASAPVKAIAPTPSPEPPAPPAEAPAQKEAAFARSFDNLDIAGTQIAALRDLDPASCVAACRERADCRGVSFDKWNRVCRLKSSVDAFRLNPRATSALREPDHAPPAPQGPIAMERYRAKAFPGAFYRAAPSATANACETSCRDDDACVAYTWRRDASLCQFFATTGEYFSDARADSGGKRRE